MKHLLIPTIFCYFFSVNLNAQNTEKPTYPVPETKNMLFYIQRSIDLNTIIYEINHNKDGTINTSKPVKIYWVEYERQGRKKSLSALQRKYAYGISNTILDKEKKWFTIHLKAYNKADIFIMNSESDINYRAYISVNGKLSVLSKIFINIEGGTFWNPNVTYIEIAGKNIENGENVTEKIKP